MSMTKTETDHARTDSHRHHRSAAIGPVPTFTALRGKIAFSTASFSWRSHQEPRQPMYLIAREVSARHSHIRRGFHHPAG